MGLFDFFKKKASNTNIAQPSDASYINKNLVVLNALESRLIEMGYDVKRHPQYLALIVNSQLEIGLAVIDNRANHPSVIHLMISVSHKQYFPDGIVENVAGMGHSLEDQVSSVLSNYINTTLLTIIDSLIDSHNPELDFMATINGKQVLWHPKPGILHTQGQWDHLPDETTLLELLKDHIPDKLTTNKFNWMKIYLSKRAGENVIGECNFNNELWGDVSNLLINYTQAWDMSGEFHGIKQFIMFRRCDAYDELA